MIHINQAIEAKNPSDNELKIFEQSDETFDNYECPPVERVVVIERHSPVETDHKIAMRNLARELAGSISLPSFWDKNLWRDLPVDFKPGRYLLPIFTLEIDKNRGIKVQYKDIGAELAFPHLLSALYSHLSTSGSRFTDLVDEAGVLIDWKNGVEQYLEIGLELLKQICDKIRKLGVEMNSNDEMMPGLTRSFPLTIWRDAIQKVFGQSWVDDSWYHTPESIPDTEFWQLRCGAYVIGIANEKDTLTTFENWHKDLRAVYANGEKTKMLATQSTGVDKITRQIKQRLLEFSDMEILPGSCDMENV